MLFKLNLGEYIINNESHETLSTCAGVALCLRAMDLMIGLSTTAVDPHAFPGAPSGE